MPHTIAFVINQVKTPFYHAWGVGLTQAGYRVVYISPSVRWDGWLQDQGVSPDDILSLGGLDPAQPPTGVHDVILAQAESAGPLTVKSMIQMDRAICKWPTTKAQNYAGFLAERIDAFLQKHDVQTVLAETTWLVEILTAQIVQARGGQFYAPSTARIPSERILFFEGPVQRSFARWTTATPHDVATAQAHIQDLAARTPQPYYMDLPNGGRLRLQHLLAELTTYLKNPRATQGDITVLPFPKRIARQISRKIKSILTRRCVPFENPDLTVPHRPFVYVTLHTQPEASIDILAAPFTNQTENLRALSRILPAGHDIWVKEHRSAIGDHWPNWYKDVARIPGVRLISPDADGFAILRKADFTISPSGTVSFEAGLVGQAASCFARMYFAPVLSIPAFCPYSTPPAEFNKILDSTGLNLQSRVNYLADIFAHSFIARIGDPITDPDCMKDDNIKALVTATDVVIQNSQALSS